MGLSFIEKNRLELKHCEEDTRQQSLACIYKAGEMILCLTSAIEVLHLTPLHPQVEEVAGAAQVRIARIIAPGRAVGVREL